MAIRPPSYVQAGSFTADDDRLLLAALLGGSPNRALTSGIVAPADYKVTQTGTASMVLDVASGSAWIVGSQSSTEGIYNVVNDDNTATVTISTADATNPRIDLVVLQVRNSEYSGTHDDAILAVVTGVPAPSPVAPAAPADSLVLAQIAVAAGATSIVTANITDERVAFGSTGGTLAANFSPTSTLTAFLTTAALGAGRWLVTLTATVVGTGAGALAGVEIAAGTAVATLLGPTSGEWSVASGNEGVVTLSTLVDVTTPGTLVFQAKGANATIRSTTDYESFAGATGYTAIRVR